MKKIILFAIGLLTSVTIYADVLEHEENGLIYQYDPDQANLDTHKGVATLVNGRNITATKLDFILSNFEEDGVTYKVTSIGNEAFTTYDNNKKTYTGNTNIKYLVIPEGITTIGKNAFRNCSNIKLLELPASISVIDADAFKDCTQLVYVCCKGTTANNTSVPSAMPSNDMMTLFVPDGSSGDTGADGKYKYNQYDWTNKFKNGIYEGGMDIVHSSVYDMDFVCATGDGQRAAIVYNGNRKTDIVVPASFIGDNSKNYTVVSVGRSAFYGFTEINTLKIENGVTSICNSAFQNCSNIRKLTIPGSINTIGNSAFANCNNIKHVWWQVEDPTKIDPTRFPNKGMMSLYVPDAVLDSYKTNDLWSNQFNNRIYGGDMVPFTDENGVEYVGAKSSTVATVYSGALINKDEIDIPATIYHDGVTYNVTGIDRGAFYNVSAITKLTIPSSITEIGASAFYNCSNLVIVYCKIESPYDIADNVFSSKTKATLFIPYLSYSEERYNKAGWNFMDIRGVDNLERFTTSNGMIYAGWMVGGEKYAKLIKGISSISSITSPVNSESVNGYQVIAIGESAFSGVRSIPELDLSSASISKIDPNAFKNCSDLKRIILPSSLASIGEKAFNGCSNLVEVETRWTGSIPDIRNKNVFPDDDMILYISSTGNGKQAYINKGWNFSHIFVGNRVTDEVSNIKYAYGSADTSNEVVLLSSATIGAEIDIKPVTINSTEKNVVAIAKNAFLNNLSLNTLDIQSGVNYIGKNAFKGCKNIKKLTLSSTINTIRDYAFDGCTSIATINSSIPGSNLFPIEEHVFSLSIVPVIYVPSGSKNKYETTNGWNRFANNYKSGAAVRGPADKNSAMYYDYYTEEKTATLAKIAGTVKTIDVPDSVLIGGVYYTVTDIGESLYKDNGDNKSSLETLTISKGIRTIGPEAFKGCSNLANVTWPDSLTIIGRSAFESTKIISVPVPKKVKSVGSYAFAYCTSLKNITLSDSLRAIEDYAFKGDTQLEVIEVPKKVETVGAYAFSGCTKLNSVTLSDSLKTIGEYAFQNNSLLTKVIIPNGVKSIGLRAFDGCSNLNWVEIPSKLERIEQYAFNDCTNLATIISRIEKEDIFGVDDNVFTSIYQKAALFVPIPVETEDAYNNETVAEYRAADGWKKFDKIVGGDKLFNTVGTIKYEYLTGPKTASVIDATITNGEIVVNDSVIIGNVSYKVDSIGVSAFENNPDRSSLVKLTLNEGIRVIGANAFKGCSKLSNVSLPESLRTIEQSAFEGNTSLTSVVIPEGVTSIGMYAFKTCTKLNRVVFPSTLTAIGDNAFEGSSDITTIISRIDKDDLKPFSDNVFHSGVYNNATLFVPMIYGNDEFNTATLNKYKGTGGWSTFNNNIVSGEKNISQPKDNIIYEYKTGPGTADVVEILTPTDQKVLSIPAKVEIDGRNYDVKAVIPSEFTNKDKIESLIIKEGIETIGEDAFKGCTSLQKVWLPKSISSIGNNAFNGCNSLSRFCIETVSLPTIATNVFSTNKPYLFVHQGTAVGDQVGWSSFSKVVEGYYDGDITSSENVSYICLHNGEGQSLTRTAIVIGSTETPSTIKTSIPFNENSYTVTTIGESAFSNKAFVNLEIPEVIVKIEANAFSNCSNLKELTLPATMDVIGANAFGSCDKIVSIISRIDKDHLKIIPTDVFTSAVHQNATLFVPMEVGDTDPYNSSTITKYKSTDGWSFGKIIGGEKKRDADGYITYEYLTGPKTATVIEINIPEGVEDLCIKDTVEFDQKYAVKVIAPIAFSGKERINTLTIKEGIDSIGANAFQNCTNLQKVWLPKSLKNKGLGSKAFNGCKSLKRVCIQTATLPTIDNDVFPTNIAYLFVPDGTTVKGLTGWSSFSKVLVGYYDGDQTLQDGTSYICLHNGEGQSIKRTAILYSSTSTSPSIEASVDYGEYPYGVTTIAESALVKKSFEKLNIPEGIKIIEGSAFKNCGSLKELVLPLSLDSIGESAFDECKNITTIISKIKQNKVFKIENNVFPDHVCQNATLFVPMEESDTDPFDNTTIQKYKSKGWIFEKTIGGEKKRDTNGCITYDYLTGPKTATVVEINIPEGVIDLCIKDTIEFDKKYAVKVVAPVVFTGKDRLEALTIKDGVDSIGNNAFQNCRNLQKLWLPKTLKSRGLGNKAFNGCTSLARVCIESTTLPEIENDVFPTNNAYLFVIKGTEYKGKKGWGNFSKVYEGRYVGESTPNNDKTYIYLSQEGNKGSAVLISSNTSDPIPTGPITFENNDYYLTIIGTPGFSGKNLNLENWNSLPEGIEIIEANAFKNCKLKELSLPSSLKAIGKNAFSGNNLKSIELPSSVTTIDDYAFQNCVSLKNIELPSSLTTIGKNAFDGCTNLTEVVCKITDAGTITGNPLSLPYATLYVANNRDKYDKQKGWEYLHILEGDRKLWDDKNGFYYAYSNVDKKAILIEAKTDGTDGDVTIPSKITIRDGDSVIPCEVIAIDNSAFSGNTNVKKVKIEDKVQTIGAYAFQGCSNLRLIELPNSLISIGEKAFEGCNNLTEVICNMGVENVNKINPQSLPNATLYVHEGTSGCYGEWKCAHIYEGARLVVPQDGLYYAYTKGAGETIVVGADISAGENITIPGAITIGEGESAENYTVVAINDEAFSGNTDIKSVKIGEKIQTIGANAFQGCTNLQKIWLPSTLTKIGEKAFDGCNSIAYICTSSKIPLESPNFSKNVFSSYSATLFVPDNEAESNYKSKDFWKIFTMKVGYLVDVKSQDNLIYECVINGDVATATLVKSETTVEDVAIPSIIKLDNDTHDYKVTTISKQVFKGNSNIVTLTIGENVKAIEDEAFMNCGKLQKVWLPSTLESIGNKAFNGSKSITRVSTKTKTMPSLGSEVFSTSTAYLFVPKGTESSWSGFAKVFEGHYVGDVTTDNISYICIENGDAAEKSAMLIKAPKAASAFASSVVLDSEAYPLTTICESAFEDNTALVNLVIPDGVKAIEANAFKNSTKLLTVELPASLEKIGDNAFQGCGLVYIQNLAETPVTISENVFTDAVYNSATLYVPDNASKNYDVEVWKKFTIVEGVYSEVSIEGMTYLCVTSQDKLVARVTKGLSKTKEVKIPAKIFIGGLNYQVLSVEKSAFEGYNTLEKVIVAEGIKSIGVAAFKECTKLKSVVLPASLESIGDNAFESCSGLETVTCAGETPVNINKNVFSVTKLEVNVPTRSSVSAYKEHTIWGAFEILYSMSSTSGSDGTENVDVATYQLVTPEGNDVTTTSVAIVDDDNVKGDFVIPTTVTRNGTPYTVTTIAPSAFEGNIELISVSLPPTVTSIGTGAFAGCENLQSMTVNNTVPPTLISTSTVAGARRMFTRGADDSPIFKGVDVENCILYVPEESIEKYKASEIWGVFKNIRAISATGMSGVNVPEGTPFDVYNLQGRKVRSGVTTLKGLTPGVYIVKGKKVAIR